MSILLLASALAFGQPTVADYAATFDRILTRDGAPVTVGPEEGSPTLTFGPLALQPDGTATGVVKRFDRDATPQWTDFTLTLRRTAAGGFELALRRPGATTDITYALGMVSDTHLTWKNDVILPHNNLYTEGHWHVEAAAFHVYLGDDGRTVYSLDDATYRLDDAYVASRYDVVVPPEGERYQYLVERGTGAAVTFRADELQGLTAQGVMSSLRVEHLDWKQLTP